MVKHLVCDKGRNEMIVNGIKKSVGSNRSVMVLTERKSTLNYLLK